MVQFILFDGGQFFHKKEKVLKKIIYEVKLLMKFFRGEKQT